MARNLSQTIKAALLSQSTPQALFTLLTLEHTGFAQTYRFVNNLEAVTSNALVYDPLAFVATWPGEGDDGVENGSLLLCNVDRLMMAEVRSIGGRERIKATLAYVLSGDPDTEIASYPAMEFGSVEADALVLRGDLNAVPFAGERFCQHSFDPSLFPGVF